MDEISKEAIFLVNNNIKTLEELLEYKNETNFRINNISANREKLWKKRKLSNDENTKHKLAKEISYLTIKLDKLRKEVDICNDIKNRVVKIDEKLSELDNQEEIEKETKEKTKEIIKGKE